MKRVNLYKTRASVGQQPSKKFDSHVLLLRPLSASLSEISFTRCLFDQFMEMSFILSVQPGHTQSTYLLESLITLKRRSADSIDAIIVIP